MSSLGVENGQVIEIVGKKSTPAIALPPYAEDEGLNIIRIDGLQRANANVSIGDHVELRAPDVRPATQITVAPAQKNVQLSGSGQSLLPTLAHRPVTTGDIISTSVTPEMEDEYERIAERLKHESPTARRPIGFATE
jgi:transitional endoplasmic reticulum ATPase